MSSNEQVVIAELPSEKLRPEHFEVVQRPAPEPGDGELLVRTLAITIGAGQRAGLQGSASYAGAPEEGVVMAGTGVGVVEGGSHPDFAEGDRVMGPLGWQQLTVVHGRHLNAVSSDGDIATQLGALGTNGLTAYFGLLDIGAPQPGETVVVSAAGGSVGHIVGQIAKLQGARVVGVAGSDDKCEMLVADLGFDEAVNYKADTFRADFKAATPDRIGVYFDNTGGPILESALFRMRSHGRIVCCGAVSQYDTSSPSGGPRGIPGLLVNNRVRMQGFLVFDYAERFAEARRAIGGWIDDGSLVARTTVYDGLDQAPRAFVDLLAGRTTGTTVVRL